jgi:hypothetical protein
MTNNWSPDLQTWCDLLNTLILQATLISDELVDALPLHRRSNASSTPRPRALFQSPPPQPSYPRITILPIHTFHLWPVVYRVVMLLHRIHTPYLHHIYTHHIHILLS